MNALTAGLHNLSPGILVVDDEVSIRRFLRERLEASGCRVVEADCRLQALERCAEDVDLVLLDNLLPDGDGVSLLEEIREAQPYLPVIIMSAFSSVSTAVSAMKNGALHFVEKPQDLEELVAVVKEGLQATQPWRCRGPGAPDGHDSFPHIIGDSPVMRELRGLLKKLASSQHSTVLLDGESGTGKDLAAKAIHFHSARKDRPFIHITCSALPDNLLESELFGYERGAFTDARAPKEGLLERANGGTVFFDEIGEMAAPLQAKLLRFLEEKTFMRVGGTSDIRVDVRVVAATNRDLEAAVFAGEFREDLYYRLRVLNVRLPPLRDRGADLWLLVGHYIHHFNRQFQKLVRGVSSRAVTLLEAYRWPGNIRELRNVLERATLLTERDVLEPDDFPVLGPKPRISEDFQIPTGGINLRDLERNLVIQALKRSGGNHSRAARLLGISRDQVRYRIQKFGLECGGQRRDDLRIKDPDASFAKGVPDVEGI